MEGLKKRTYIFAAVMLLAGVVNIATVARAEKSSKDEKWMEARAPEKIGDAPYFKSADNPAQSYRMNDITYKMLAPFGIVARQYTTKEGKVFDVVLIASGSRASFHDPRICFSGSGWTIADQHTVDVHTRTRGVIPVMLVSMESGEKRNQLAAFFYRGPSGFQSSTRGLKWNMFVETFLSAFMKRPAIEGVFYRFIPQYAGANEEELKAFIADYLEASKDSSGGYF